MLSTAGEESGQLAVTLEEWRRNWRVGLATFLGMGLGNSIMHSVFSLFVLPLEEAFGWSRGEIALATSTSILAGLSAPMIGRFIDTRGVRKALLAGFFMLALTWLALAAMPGWLFLFYALWGVLVIAGLPPSGLGYARVICATFVRSRGVSLAIGRGGMSASAIVLPPVLYAAISAWGFRGGFLLMAALVSGIGLVTTWLWIGRGASGSGFDGEAMSAEPTTRMPLLAALRDRRVLAIAIGAATAYAPITAIVSHAQPLLVGKGLSGEEGAMLVGFLGLTSLGGALLTGVVLDRFWAPAVACVLLLLGMSGVFVLALAPGDFGWSALGIVLLGLAFGAEIDISAFVVARYCGLRHYSSIYGLTILVISTASAAASPALGFAYDAFGDYRLGLLVCAMSFIVAIAAYLSLGRYPDPQPE